MAKETFKQARERIFKGLAEAEWEVTTFSVRTMKALKVPYATRSDGGNVDKLWFQPQALYYSCAPRGYSSTVNDSRSIESDIRGLSIERIEELVRHFR